MKLIFMDVDGVLNHAYTPEAFDSFVALDAVCVEQMQRILAETKANIVVSSTWRMWPVGRDALAATFGNAIIGSTPRVKLNAKRRDEIFAWLDRVWPYCGGWNGEVISALAVIDDDIDANLGDGSFFKTEWMGGGLTKEVADKVIAYLNGGNLDY